MGRGVHTGCSATSGTTDHFRGCYSSLLFSPGCASSELENKYQCLFQLAVFPKHWSIYVQSILSFPFSAPMLKKKKNHLIFYKPSQRTLDHKPETHRTSSSLSSFSENKINLSNGFAAMLLLLNRFSSVRLVVTLWTIAHQALHPWDSPSKNTGVSCHSLLQAIFLTQGSNPRLLCLLHWQAGSLPLTSLMKPLWIAFPFSRGSSQPRDWTQVSCIASEFFTSWATREALCCYNSFQK